MATRHVRVIPSAAVHSLVALLLTALAGGTLAQTPRPLQPQPLLRVRDAERPIEVAALDVRVVIRGLHAETIQTVTFRNPNARVLEGELEFPLPDGATVSGFALDVGGQMVDGVVVSKQKARVVLETEIRRGVDPGIAEHVRGNLYRARVYPIPARGARTVRLAWVSELTTRGEDALYRLPLPYDRPIGEVGIRVEVVRAPDAPEISGGFGELTPRRSEDRWIAEARLGGVAPARDLLVRLPKLPAQLVQVEPAEGREAFFSATELVPALAGAPAPPRRIAVAWDASGSREAAATERELAFLSRLLSAWPSVAVDLVVFRDRPERPVAFEAGDRGVKLVAALRAAPSDGGTALAGLDLARRALPNAADDLWLLFSDGIGTLGEALPMTGDVPVWTVTGAAVADRAVLRHLAGSTGADLLDLVALEPAAAVEALVAPRPRLLRAAAPGGVADLLVVQRAGRARATVLGRLVGDEATLTLVFGAGRATVERTVKVRRAEAAASGGGPGPVAIAWAQAQVERLGLFAERNAEALLAIGRRFGLVTPGTSLLVLETLEQHLEHGVEPVASRPQLRAEYLARVAEREQRRKAIARDHLEEVVRLWQARVRWWETKHEVPPGWKYEERAARDDALGGAVVRRRSALAPEAPRAMVDAPSAAIPAAPGFMASEAAPAPVAREAKKVAVASGATEASIAIAPWDPKVPYLEPLRRAAPGGVYAAYLAERKAHASPAFFLDCAEHLLRRGERELGLRVLTNLAELRIDDAALLRVLAWRLAQERQLDAAATVLEKVLRLRPEEPQSRRDLALVLADRAEARNDRADARRAADLLYDVVLERWERFPEIELIALMELNRLLARAERRGWADVARAERVDPRLRKLLDLDLRVSLSWDADLTDVDLHLFEPTGEHAFYGHQGTALGGLVSRDVTQGYGPEEYVVRRAAPGRYAVKVHYYGSRQQTLVGPATLTATVFTNWGRPDEKREVLTLRLANPRELEDVGVVTIGAGGIARASGAR